MVSGPEQGLVATCRCGEVVLEAREQPIVSVACYCASCQAAGRQLEALVDAAPMLEEDGGTSFILFRKDRIRFRNGKELLREHRLTPDSTTRRVVAACCNSAMFLEFTNGHWLSLYGRRVPPDDRPRLEMRVMARDRKPGVEFNDLVPSYRTHSGKFMFRLFSAWAAMGFKAPRIGLAEGALHDQGR
jgi:hypothetical protein